MKTLKEMYRFFVDRKESAIESTESKDEAGDAITVSKTVIKDIPKEFCLIKPRRSLVDKAEMFYHVEIGEGIRAGLLSAALLEKRFSNDGGVFSKQQKSEYSEKFAERVDAEFELQAITVKPEEDRTEEEKAAHRSLLKKIGNLNREMQKIEMREQTLFNITAESRARTKTIIWWVLFLLHKKNSLNQWVPFFEGKDIEEKYESYDAIEEDDELPEEERIFLTQVIQKASQAVALWYYGRAFKQDEFEKVLGEIARDIEAENAALEEEPIAAE